SMRLTALSRRRFTALLRLARDLSTDKIPVRCARDTHRTGRVISATFRSRSWPDGVTNASGRDTEGGRLDAGHPRPEARPHLGLARNRYRGMIVSDEGAASAWARVSRRPLRVC